MEMNMGVPDRVIHPNRGREAQKKTTPFDARFPNANQTRNCWQNYVDFHRCLKIKGQDYEPCNYFQKIYSTICPDEWVVKWDEQKEAGIFAANI